MKYTGPEGSVYVNNVIKNGKSVWVIKGIGNTHLITRDKKTVKSRSFDYEHHMAAYLKRHNFV